MVTSRASPTLQTILTAQLNSSSPEDKEKAYDSISEIAGNFSWEKQKAFMMALFPSTEYKSLNKEAVKKEFTQIQKKLKKTHPSSLSTDQLLTHFKALVASPAEYPGDIYDAPVVEVTSTETDPAKMTKLSLRHDLEKDTYIQDCSYLSPKSGGANKPGPLGANYLRVYMTKDGRLHGQKLFIKQATDDNKPNQRENMSEVIAGRIMNAVAGDHIASTFHTFPKPGDKDPTKVYVVSIFYDSYKDLHTAAHEAIRPGKKPPKRGKGAGGGQNINARPLQLPKIGNVGGTPDYQPGLEKVFQKIKRGHGFVKGANYFVSNHQGHSENEGIILSAGREVVGGIDFGGAFRRPYSTTQHFLKPKTKETGKKFQRVVHPEQIEGRKYNVAYFLATPESIRYSKDFIDEIDQIANVDKNIILKSVDEAIDYAVQYYGTKDFLQYFASELDKTNKELNLSIGTDEEKVAATKTFLKNTLLARQLSLKEFSLQSKLKHIEKKGTDFQLSDLMHEHPIYFSFTKTLDFSEWTPLEQNLLSHLKENHNLTSLTDDFYKKIKNVLGNASTLIAKEDLDKLIAIEGFLKYVLQSGHYDFNDKNDQEILIQACDEAYQNLKLVLEKIPESNISKKKLLEEMNLPPEVLRPRNATMPSVTGYFQETSSTSVMSKNMETQRIMKMLSQQGLTTQLVDEKTIFTDKEIQKTAHELGAKTIYTIGEGSPAKGAVFLDKKTHDSYEIIPVRPPDEDTIEAKLANAHAVIGVFISQMCYGAPLYLFNARHDELTQFYLAICDANGLKVYDEAGVLLEKNFPRDKSIIVPEHLKFLDPNKIKTATQQKYEVGVARDWLQAVEKTFPFDKLDKAQLLNLQNQLMLDKKRCDTYMSQFKQDGVTELETELNQASARLAHTLKSVNQKLASLPPDLKIRSAPIKKS